MLDLFNFSMLIPSGARERGRGEAAARAAAQLSAFARLEGGEVLTKLGSALDGLSDEQVAEFTAEFGPNIVAQEKKKPFLLHILERFATNPINILLTILAAITWATGGELSDRIGAVIMIAMVVMAVFVAHFQEARSSRAVEQLRRMVSNTATVRREVDESEDHLDENLADEDAPLRRVGNARLDFVPSRGVDDDLVARYLLAHRCAPHHSSMCSYRWRNAASAVNP